MRARWPFEHAWQQRSAVQFQTVLGKNRLFDTLHYQLNPSTWRLHCWVSKNSDLPSFISWSSFLMSSLLYRALRTAEHVSVLDDLTSLPTISSLCRAPSCVRLVCASTHTVALTGAGTPTAPQPTSSPSSYPCSRLCGWRGALRSALRARRSSPRA